MSRSLARRSGRLAGGILLSITFWFSGTAFPAQPEEVDDFGPNPGNLRMWLYTPDDLPASAPLVVALHGCLQSAADYDDETGWIKYADSLGFALLLPEQKPGWWFGNHPLGCFNWFYRDDQSRGSGEAESIRQMIDRVIAVADIDRDRVFITGLSAGGAMAAVMLAAYPEYFAGGAIIAGIPYGCSSVPGYVPHASIPYMSYWLSYTDPLRCMKPGWDRTPSQWGDEVASASPPNVTGRPLVSIWQGTADNTVSAVNANELVEQWTTVHGTDASAQTEESVGAHTHRVYHDAVGDAVVELFLIESAGHGIPINPGNDPAAADQCGITGDYMIPSGICASYHIARFWRLVPP